MKEETSLILKEILEEIEPSKKEKEEIGLILKDFVRNLNKILKQKKVKAEIFVGGSYAKKTIIKKGKYDIDLFLRFDKKYAEENISKILENVLKNLGEKYEILKGSRNYFRIEKRNNLFFEIVPVLKTKNPKEAENITDLSYMHVKYINKKVKSNKILQGIKLAKSFCHAQRCYGAESYINGFSGYSLELLIYSYGSFLNFVKAMSKVDKNKLIIDIEGLHKKKKNILLDINESKLGSPIVLVDPTYKYRNVLAALSEETLNKFQKNCREFLKKPSKEFFKRKELNFEEMKEKAKKGKEDYVILEIATKKQAGDIAGSKLKKFYRHLIYEIEKYFDIKNSEFDYLENKKARFFFSVKPKKIILIEGPKIKDKKNVVAFEKIHKNRKEKLSKKSGRVYALKKVNFPLKKFILDWKNQNKNKISSMSIVSLEIFN